MPAEPTAALQSWLRSNGAPALIPRRTALHAIGDPFLLIGFSVRSLVQTVVQRSSSMLAIVPLLLVALTLSFFSTEVWQTIGRLHGLPLVLVTLLFVALAAAFAIRQSKPDLDEMARFEDAADLRAELPGRLSVGASDAAFDTDAAPPLRRRERTNLLVISVLSQVITATVIALLVFAFFVVLGVLAIDREATDSWLGHHAHVPLDVTLAGHEYILSNELLRVSAFLGAFTGFYFLVSSASDARFRADLESSHERHVRACLAVRHLYWQLTQRPRPSPT